MGSAGCACKVLRRDARIDVRLPGYRLQFERTLTATSQQQDFGAATVHSAAKMKVVVVIFLWYLPLLFGFCRLVCFNRISPLGMEISAKGLPLSKILKERVEHKIGKVIDKLGQDATFHNVVLKVIKRSITESHTNFVKRGAHTVEVTVGLKGGTVVHARENSDDMLVSIDQAAHKLSHLLQKHHSKVTDKSHKARRRFATSVAEPDADIVDDETSVQGSSEAMWSEDGLIGMEQQDQDMMEPPKGDQFVPLLRKKVFSMPPVSVEEAIAALELIDHPFYVFRNKDTNEINLVYRRDSGGVGHIAPEGGHAA